MPSLEQEVPQKQETPPANPITLWRQKSLAMVTKIPRDFTEKLIGFKKEKNKDKTNSIVILSLLTKLSK